MIAVTSSLMRASEFAAQEPAIVFEAVPSTSRSLASGVLFTPMLPVADETVRRSEPPEYRCQRPVSASR